MEAQGRGPPSSDLCLLGSTPTASYEEEELPPDPSEETLTIEARFQPLLPESMTKSKDGFLGVSLGGGGEPQRWDHRWRAIYVHQPPENEPSSSSLSVFLYQLLSVHPVRQAWGPRGGCVAVQLSRHTGWWGRQEG